MELPHIGKHCALKQCNQLDFLPIKCDSCSEVYCIQHYLYEAHNCEKAKNKNFQVPVCPLCSQPVATKRDQLPDIAVSQHIDQYCKQNDQVQNRIKSPTSLQACSFKSCKQKDLIYLECNDCKAKFCIKHRHPTDHSCAGPPPSSFMGQAHMNNLANSWQSFRGSCSTSATNSCELIKNKAHQISKSGQAALNRLTNRNYRQEELAANGLDGRQLQGNLTDEEALAIAMSESRSSIAKGDNRSYTNNFNNNQTTEEEDAALAKALYESELEARRSRANRQTATTTGQNKDTCIIG